MLFEYSLLTDKKEVEPLTDFLMDRAPTRFQSRTPMLKPNVKNRFSVNPELKLMISLGTAPDLKSSAETTST